jgi:O-acetyl-ADP-ribose deacetylase (regulator of RNase III)
MGKRVTFNDDIAIVSIPFEDRKGVWMTLAADRFRFQRRIKQLSQILDPILRRHVKLQANGVTFLKGDVVEIKNVDAIVHQCNCLTVKSHGLSKQIARKFPWADVYRMRRSVQRRNLAIHEDRAVPGSIKVMKSEERPHVVCLMAQWDFGRRHMRKVPPYEDTKENRKKWFQTCLSELGKTHYRTLAFPFKIGCGLAGGHWPTYLASIRRFADEFHKQVFIVVKDRKPLGFLDVVTS